VKKQIFSLRLVGTVLSAATITRRETQLEVNG